MNDVNIVLYGRAQQATFERVRFAHACLTTPIIYPSTLPAPFPSSRRQAVGKDTTMGHEPRKASYSPLAALLANGTIEQNQ